MDIVSSVNIIGIDEAGRIGDYIIFTRASVERDNEINLLLRNLEHFGKIILNKKDISGYEVKNLMNYVRDISDDEVIDISISIMRHRTQNLLLGILFSFLSDDLFRTRGELIELFQAKDWSIIQRTLNSLNRFKRRFIYAESFVKAFGMKKIAEEVGRRLLREYGSIEQLSKDDAPMTIIQIDGGFPFAFWWDDLLHSDSGLVFGKALITGITNGDSYYPTISTAGTISEILLKHPEKQYMFPVKELTVEPSEIYDENMPRFYSKHSEALGRAVYQHRILLIGSFNDDLLCCIPYLKHLKEQRKKTFEVWTIDSTMQNFCNDFGYGISENTHIVVGNLTYQRDRDNLTWCRQRGYPIEYTSDYKDSFDSLIASLSSEIDLAPSKVRDGISRKLGNFERSCRKGL